MASIVALLASYCNREAATLASMRIGYFSNLRLPSERAYGHQVAGVCNALMQLSHEVHIYAPYRENPIKEDFWHYHGVSRGAQLTHLGSFDPIGKWWLPGVMGLVILNVSLCRALRNKLKNKQYDVLYTRTPALLPVLLRSGIPVILELHRLPRFLKKQFVYRCSRCALVVCLTSLMRDELLRWGVPSEKVIVEGDGVDLILFNRAEQKCRRVMVSPSAALRTGSDEPSRRQTLCSFDSAQDDTGLPLTEHKNIPTIGYTGQLESMGLSKGLPVFFDAFELLSKNINEFHVLIAGGPLKTQERLEHSLRPALRNRVKFLGFVQHQRIPSILAACDVLVYPAPTSKKSFYQRDTSPLKIFEYMAARRPIVSADLPPIREILDEETAFFCVPGDAKDLARAIEEVLRDPDESQRRAKNALERVKEHTWEKRMERILSAYKQRV